MKRLFVVGLAALSMGVSAVGVKKVNPVNAGVDQTTFKLSEHNETMFKIISSEINDSMDNCYTFLTNWINDDTENIGFNFFENNYPTDIDNFDLTHLRYIKDSIYFDYLFQDYLLSYAVEDFSVFMGYLDKLPGIRSEMNDVVDYLGLGVLPNDSDLICYVYGEAYQVYQTIKEIALEMLYDGQEDGFVDHFMKPAVGSIKAKLVSDSEKVNNGTDTPTIDLIENVSQMLSRLTGDSEMDIEGLFLNYLSKSTYYYDSFELLGFNEGALNSWIENPEESESTMLDHYDQCYNAIFHFIITIRNLEKSYVDGFNFSKHLSDNLTPILYDVLSLIESFNSKDILNVCDYSFHLIKKVNDFVLYYYSCLTEFTYRQGEMEDLITDHYYNNWVDALMTIVDNAKTGFDALVLNFLSDTLEDDLDTEINKVVVLVEKIRERVAEGVLLEFCCYTPQMEQAMKEYDDLLLAIKNFIEVQVPEEMNLRTYYELQNQYLLIASPIYPIAYGEYETAQEVKEAIDDLDEISDTLDTLINTIIENYNETLDERFIELYQSVFRRIVEIGTLQDELRNSFIQQEYGDLYMTFAYVAGMLEYIDEIFINDASLWDEQKESVELILSIFNGIEARIEASVEALGEDGRYTQLLEYIDVERDSANILIQNIVANHNEVVAIEYAENSCVIAQNKYAVLSEAVFVDDEEYEDNLDLIDVEIGLIQEAITKIETDIVKYPHLTELVTCKQTLEGYKDKYVTLKEELTHNHLLLAARYDVEGTYLGLAEHFVVIASSYYLNDSMYENNKEAVNDIFNDAALLKEDIETYIEELGEDETLETYLESLSIFELLLTSLLEDIEEFHSETLAVNDVTTRYEEMLAKFETIKLVYKFDVEHGNDYVTQLDSILENINTLKEDILKYIDECGELEIFLQINGELSDLRIECEAIRNEIAASSFEVEVNAILNDAAGLEARVDEIANNYKKNSLNYSGDIEECEGIAGEIEALIAKIDAKTSLSSDTRLVELRAKLVNYSETISQAQKSIEKKHNGLIAAVVVSPIVLILGILTLLYFFGFKKRFLRKAA